MAHARAKALRKTTFKDVSFKQERDYLITGKGTVINHPDSLRAKYQAAKKQA